MFLTQAVQVTNVFENVDLTFGIILGVAIFSILFITILMFIFIVRYRQSKQAEDSQSHVSTKLEIFWTAIPTALVLVMFWFGWTGWKPMTKPPQDAIASMENIKLKPYPEDTALVLDFVTEKTKITGFDILKNNGCNTCHSADGYKIGGPSFKGLWGSTATIISNGKEKQITVDDEYIKHSIYDPNAYIIKGYGKDHMKSFKGKVKEDEIEFIIKYIESLK